MLDTENRQSLIDNGEGYNVEFKVRVPSKVRELTEEIWEIPLTVFKEAIINALSHRNYYEQRATITIEMFNDTFSVHNFFNHSCKNI